MESLRVGLPTLVLILVYLAGINVLGAWIGRGQKDARDYFLGSHAMPWWAVMGSIVATETSALTFLSIPGDAYRTGFAFLQLVFGYILGRFACSCRATSRESSRPFTRCSRRDSGRPPGASRRCSSC